MPIKFLAKHFKTATGLSRLACKSSQRCMKQTTRVEFFGGRTACGPSRIAKAAFLWLRFKCGQFWEFRAWWGSGFRNAYWVQAVYSRTATLAARPSGFQVYIQNITTCRSRHDATCGLPNSELLGMFAQSCNLRRAIGTISG